MIDATKTNLGRYRAQASADAGYCSEGDHDALETRSIDGYVAAGRARDAVAGTVDGRPAAVPGAPEPASTSQPEAEPEPEAEPKPTRVEAMRASVSTARAGTTAC
jgi:hypothetical protein